MISDVEYMALMEHRKNITSVKSWGDDKSDKEFIKGMTLLTPQSYGAKIEERIRKILNFSKNKSGDDCGDLKSPSGKNIEIKSSILTITNDALNLVQIRLFHDVDYYLCIAYDCRDIINFKTYIFLLSHDDMKAECEITNASAAHGTRTVNKINNNIELRLSILCNLTNKIFQRWCEKYLMESFDEVASVLGKS
jgi:hypothetical protein